MDLEAKKRADFDHWVAEGKERGFKPGYAKMKFKEQYGEWPPWDWSKDPKVKPTDSIGKVKCSSCNGTGYVDDVGF